MINKLFRRLRKPDSIEEKSDLRIIKTARSRESINKAAEKGYWPLVKPVMPLPDIKSKFAIKQDDKTGKISVVNDFRGVDRNLKIPGKESIPVKSDIVIDWTYYYPYQFESPYAAYLLPTDLKVGETVILDDLIEDVVGGRWNQGDTFRLKSCTAVWDGKEFVLQHDPSKEVSVVG